MWTSSALRDRRPRGVVVRSLLRHLGAARRRLTRVSRRGAVGGDGTGASWPPAAGLRGGQLVAATDEVRLLRGVAGQLDDPVVRRARLLTPALPAQQVGT